MVVGGVGKSNFINCIDVVNKTSLKELIVYINSADYVISGDSGPLHIAVALNKKVLGIFGPTNRELAYYPRFSNVKVLEVDSLGCRPCSSSKKYCPKGAFQVYERLRRDNS